MNDTISRQAAISFIENVPYIKDHQNMGDLIKKWLEQIPTVQPEQKTGKWEKRFFPDDDPYFQVRYYCTACECWNTYGETEFCPHCGAKMEGENDN